MIQKEFYKTRGDGVNLYRTYSDANVMIKKDGTEEIYSEAIDIENSGFTYTETDIPIDDGEESTGDLTVDDTLQIPIQEEDDELQEILNYYIDGIKKGYISNDDIPLKYRDKIVEYLK